MNCLIFGYFQNLFILDIKGKKYNYTPSGFFIPKTLADFVLWVSLFSLKLPRIRGTCLKNNYILKGKNLKCYMTKIKLLYFEKKNERKLQNYQYL
jgi:hypothetical protein